MKETVLRNLFWCLLLSLGLLFLVIACEGTESQLENRFTCQTIEDGTNIRITTITSEKRWLVDRQEHITKQLEQMINSGKYNVVSINTTYTYGYLDCAVVNYNQVEDGEGRNLRVKLLHGQCTGESTRNWAAIQTSIELELDTFVNSGKYNIDDIKKILRSGKIVAAEVYYYEE